MNSSIEARTVDATSSTAWQEAPSSANVATTVHAGGGGGISRSTMVVMMPSVPSLPTNSLVSESPAASLIRGPPRFTAVPSASTTVRPST